MSRQNYKYNKNAKWNLEDAIKFLKKPKGRIKRMRALKPKSTSEKLLEWAYKYWNQNKQFHYHITRWNRH